ncbi:MAG: hypothetical protein LBG42_03000 [Treponema sp.]|nr:hypothetical protein [Treponema sp.]
MYYIMVTGWKVRGGYPKVRVDVTYIDEPGKPAVFNVSLVQRKEPPRSFGPAFINDGLSSFPLEDISVLLVNPEDNLLRITSNINSDNFAALLDAKNISLIFTLDGREYQAVPPRKFYLALDEVRKGAAYFN